VSIAKRWDRGEQIANVDIRKALAEMPLRESKESLQELYKFFSKGSHPNRELVGERFLGDGNQFVLGSIGKPDLLLIVLHCMRLVEMWFWFGAVAGFIAKEALAQIDPTFGSDYLTTAEKASRLKKSLGESFQSLLAEYQEGRRS
jgi:hypothetical protein